MDSLDVTTQMSDEFTGPQADDRISDEFLMNEFLMWEGRGNEDKQINCGAWRFPSLSWFGFCRYFQCVTSVSLRRFWHHSLFHCNYRFFYPSFRCGTIFGGRFDFGFFEGWTTWLNGNLCGLRAQIFDYVFVADSYGDQPIVMELYRAEKLCVIIETGLMSNILSQNLGDFYQILPTLEHSKIRVQNWKRIEINKRCFTWSL